MRKNAFPALQAQKPATLLVAFAWVVTLLVSNLPNAVLLTLQGKVPDIVLLGMKAGFLAVMIVLALLWRPLTPLWRYFLILLLLAPAHLLIATSYGWNFWSRFGDLAWVVGIGGIRLLNVLLAGVMIAALLALGYRARQFFLRAGDLNARVQAVRWLGMKSESVWRRFGAVFTISATAGLLLFLTLSNPPTGAVLLRTLPWLPFFILFAALNAFGEEVGIRVPMLATVHQAIGRQNALFLTALYFGLLHYDSFPAGIIWVIETGFLGYIFAKSMLETEGIGWAWFIHFIVDIPVYAFMAMNSVARAGG